MDIESQKLMQEQFSKLPTELQAALKSPQLHEKIRIIGSKHQLHIDQMGKLEDEVVMFMMGFTEPEEFMSQLVNDLSVSTTTAGDIAVDIGKEIMVPIRGSMKKADGQGAPSGPSTPVTSAISKPAELHPADAMLSQKTVTTVAPPTPKPLIPPAAPKVEPTAPQPYKADPYREPTT